MTVREFDRAVLTGHTVVAIIPTTKNDRWASSQAWNIARAAAGLDSHVVLVDLSLERPVLDNEADNPAEEGIVDAFLYGVSLNRVARAQEPPGLHYIGVGTPTARPEEVWSHARWQRLAKGFTSEGALLLLFTPPSAIPHMTLLPNALILLEATPTRAADPMLPVNPMWLGKVPLLTTLVDPTPPITTVPPVATSEPDFSTVEDQTAEKEPATPDAPDAPDAPAGALRHRRRTAKKKHVGLAALAVAALGLWGVLRWAESASGDSFEGVPPTSDQSELSPVSAGIETKPEPAETDSLYYSVQIAAFSEWDRAIEYASSIERETLTAAVTPIRVGRRVWYRVILGALYTATVADNELKALWRSGLVEAGQGTILRTPQAFDLGSRESVRLAREEARKLRDRGIPAYGIQTSSGAARILVGAFENPGQAGVAESLLTAAGLPTTLILRTGIVP